MQEELSNRTEPLCNEHQLKFVKYTLFILIDLVILSLFSQYWDLVYIETFTIALLTAIMLQFLMQVAIKIEHYAAGFITATGKKGKIIRGISAWAIIFVLKLIILELINISFGDSVLFTGPIHGVVAFLTVVIFIIIAEQSIVKIFRSLK